MLCSLLAGQLEVSGPDLQCESKHTDRVFTGIGVGVSVIPSLPVIHEGVVACRPDRLVCDSQDGHAFELSGLASRQPSCCVTSPIHGFV